MKGPSVLQVLKAARDKIADPVNWGKGPRSSRTVFDTCCIAEAVEETGLDVGYWDVRRHAFRALRWAIGYDETWDAIVVWNDAPERTHAEVLAAFNLAIALERNMPLDSTATSKADARYGEQFVKV